MARLGLAAAGAGWTQSVTAVATGVAALGFLFAAAGTWLAWRGLKENAKGRHAQIAVDLGPVGLPGSPADP